MFFSFFNAFFCKNIIMRLYVRPFNLNQLPHTIHTYVCNSTAHIVFFRQKSSGML